MWRQWSYLEFLTQVVTLPSLILALSLSGVTSSIRFALQLIRIATSPHSIPLVFWCISFFRFDFVFISVCDCVFHFFVGFCVCKCCGSNPTSPFRFCFHSRSNLQVIFCLHPITNPSKFFPPNFESRPTSKFEVVFKIYQTPLCCIENL